MRLNHKNRRRILAQSLCKVAVFSYNGGALQGRIVAFDTDRQIVLMEGKAWTGPLIIPFADVHEVHG